MIAIDNDIWLAEGACVRFFGLPYSTRMTVIRLTDGSLWVHSPIALTDALAAQVDALGSVRYLIAPNQLHHLFLEQWQQRYPQASCYATDALIRKRDDLYFDYPLRTELHYAWSDQIFHLLFTGSVLMQECVFFHPPSKTLLVTDLIENFAPRHFHGWQRLLARMTGIVAPNGKMPIDWRLSFCLQRALVREHLGNMLAWQPQRIVMAHGEVIHECSAEHLRMAFRCFGLTK